MSEAEDLARALYTQRCTPQGPPWDQLGDVTRAVWIEIAQCELFGNLA